jgi:Skp family chaperone for outer membrane proteins
MKKLLVSLMALSVLSIGTAASAGPLSDAMNKATSAVTKHENNMTQAQKDAQARQKARQAEIEKQKKEWAKKQEKAKKDDEFKGRRRDYRAGDQTAARKQGCEGDDQPFIRGETYYLSAANGLFGYFPKNYR